MKKNIDRIVLEYECCCSPIIDEFCEKLYSNFLNIENYFDIPHFNISILMLSKQDFDKSILSMTKQFGQIIPEWLVGYSTPSNIYICCPKSFKIDYMVQVTIHEIIHLFTHKLASNGIRPKLLDEGIATYLAKQCSSSRIGVLKRDLSNNSLKKISDFCIFNGGDFAKINGYAYSYFIMEFLFQKYDKKDIIYFLENPNSFLQIVNDQLESEFIQYVSRK